MPERDEQCGLGTFEMTPELLVDMLVMPPGTELRGLEFDGRHVKFTVAIPGLYECTNPVQLRPMYQSVSFPQFVSWGTQSFRGEFVSKVIPK